MISSSQARIRVNVGKHDIVVMDLPSAPWALAIKSMASAKVATRRLANTVKIASGPRIAAPAVCDRGCARLRGRVRLATMVSAAQLLHLLAFGRSTISVQPDLRLVFKSSHVHSDFHSASGFRATARAGGRKKTTTDGEAPSDSDVNTVSPSRSLPPAAGQRLLFCACALSSPCWQ